MAFSPGKPQLADSLSVYSSTCSGRKSLQLSGTGFYGSDVLSDTQSLTPTGSLSHPLFIHHQTPDRSGITAFLLALQLQYEKNTIVAKHHTVHNEINGTIPARKIALHFRQTKITPYN